MTFDDLLEHAIAMLRRRRRVSYRALQRQFGLDDAYLADLKTELITVHRLAVDQDGVMLVWIGNTGVIPGLAAPSPPSDQQRVQQEGYPTAVEFPPAESRIPEAERRQLTVMFCDLVDSTRLSGRLDPEDYRDVVRAYQEVAAAVIQRFEGYIAQYLGDGLLVYFGYPQAHEDDAQLAVRAGLNLLQTIEPLNTRLERDKGVRLAVRIGIHTGPVVVGDMGGGRHERLALGETPNIASRLEGLAAPDSVVVSVHTRQLVGGAFALEDLGVHALKGVAKPMQVYGVRGERTIESRFETATTTGLTPLVGRTEEIGLVLRRWEQAKRGEGQVVLLSGEPGIGKSRIIQTVCERVAHEPHTRLRYQCLPYYANSAFYPIVAQLERAARFARDDTPDQKLAKLEALLAQSTESIAEVAPLLAALLSIPTGDHYPPLHLSPQRQKAKTIEVLVDQLVGLSHRQPVVCIFEDAHWGDPTSREVLDLIVNRVPNERVLMVITYRPEFEAPWTAASHVTALTLTRLRREQVVTMVEQLTVGKALPHEVRDQIIAKTDGIPLFVEELTKTILESGLLREMDDHYTLIGPLPPLAIPATLQDSLMARLDRLAPVKEVAQLGAAIGREFSYELLAAVTPLRHMELEDALNQLIEAELLFRRGQPPEAHYRFKHALVQDTAYASLLRSTRQSLHARIATVLEERFPATAATEPEVLAHHYTEAGFREQAVNYWKLAGQRAVERSANSEAVQHLTKGLELLVTLPETPTRTLQELDLQLVLGPALMATRGIATPEVEQIYARARVLCAQAGETPQVFLTLRGLWQFYYTRGALPTARELGEQILSLAQREASPTPRLEAYDALGGTLFYLGEYADAQMYLEQGIALTDPAAQRALTLRHGVVPGVSCLTVAALTLWCLGYPARAMQRGREALALAQDLEHPYSLAVAQHFIAFLHYRRRDASAVQEQADVLLPLATAQGFPLYVGHGTCWRGWVLAMQGQSEAGLVQLGQGLAAVVATGLLLSRPFHLILLVEAAGHAGQVEEGLRLLAEAMTAFEASGRGDMLAEAYRLQGELLLRQAIPDAAQAEACFQQALALARCQQAKSWELRAAISLSHLWKQQGKRAEAQALLAPIYHWFTEGFDTADLQEAKALLKNLGMIVDT